MTHFSMQACLIVSTVLHICSAPCAAISVRSISTHNALQGAFEKTLLFGFWKEFDHAAKIIRFTDSAIHARTFSVFFGWFWRWSAMSSMFCSALTLSGVATLLVNDFHVIANFIDHLVQRSPRALNETFGEIGDDMSIVFHWHGSTTQGESRAEHVRCCASTLEFSEKNVFWPSCIVLVPMKKTQAFVIDVFFVKKKELSQQTCVKWARMPECSTPWFVRLAQKTNAQNWLNRCACQSPASNEFADNDFDSFNSNHVKLWHLSTICGPAVLAFLAEFEEHKMSTRFRTRQLFLWIRRRWWLLKIMQITWTFRKVLWHAHWSHKTSFFAFASQRALAGGSCSAWWGRNVHDEASKPWPSLPLKSFKLEPFVIIFGARELDHSCCDYEHQNSRKFEHQNLFKKGLEVFFACGLLVASGTQYMIIFKPACNNLVNILCSSHSTKKPFSALFGMHLCMNSWMKLAALVALKGHSCRQFHSLVYMH